MIQLLLMLKAQVTKFYQENKCLCLSGLGVPILGFLLYRVVKLLIEKCRTTKKIEKTTLPILLQRSVPEKKTLEKNLITTGYGEYIVFDTENRPLKYDQFLKVHRIFQKYSPGGIATRFKGRQEEGAKEYALRYSLIKNEVQALNKDYAIAFVPKVLYELTLIHKGIQEELKEGHPCSNLNPQYATWRKKCWHLPRIADTGVFTDAHEEKVAQLAYRINQALVKNISSNAPCTADTLESLLEKELNYFYNYYHSNQITALGNKTHAITPSIMFSKLADRTGYVNLKTVGISTKERAEILRKVFRLEISPAAKDHLFLYRGADYGKDRPFFIKGEDPNSLSYGSGVFAGVNQDPGATACHYMFTQKDAFAIQLPFALVDDSPFYFPRGNTIRQVNSHGENFHGRSKLWKNSQTSYRKSELHLKSDLGKKDFLKLFYILYRNAVKFK